MVTLQIIVGKRQESFKLPRKGRIYKNFKLCNMSITFISRLMRSVVQNVDIKIYVV